MSSRWRRVLSSPYALAIWLRHSLFDLGILRATKVPGIVTVSLGNVACGGSGKTPLAMYLLEQFQGVSTAYISRGYGRHLGQGPWARFGDEASLVAHYFPDTKIYIGKNRVDLVKKARDEGCQVAFLDDAMQHRYLVPDFSIALIDAKRPPSKDCLLPFGRLRDFPSRLRLCDLIVYKGSVKKKEFTIATQMHMIPEGIYLLDQTPFIPKERVALLSGIANPASFLETIQEMGYTVVIRKELRDHAPISLSDLHSFCRQAASLGAQALLCTEKDRIKWMGCEQRILHEAVIPVAFVKMRMSPLEGKAYLERLIKRIHNEIVD